MEGMYLETSVRKQTSIMQKFLIGVIVFVSLLAFMIANSVMWIVGVVVAIAGAIGIYQAWLRLNVEYEYVFCDGQIDFDVIYNGAKRKNLLKIDVENADKIAVFDDSEITSVGQIDTVKKFVSGKEGTKPYAIIIKKDGKHMKVLFEPSKEMLEKIRMKAPRITKIG